MGCYKKLKTNNYKYYDLMMAAFVTVLITANIIGPAKISQLDLPIFGVITFGAGVLFFPISRHLIETNKMPDNVNHD